MLISAVAVASACLTGISGCCGEVTGGYELRGRIVDVLTGDAIQGATVSTTTIVYTTEFNTPLDSPLEKPEMVSSSANNDGEFILFVPTDRFFTCSFMFVGPRFPFAGPPDQLDLEIRSDERASVVSVALDPDSVIDVEFNETDMLFGIIELSPIGVDFAS